MAQGVLVTPLIQEGRAILENPVLLSLQFLLQFLVHLVHRLDLSLRLQRQHQGFQVDLVLLPRLLNLVVQEIHELPTGPFKVYFN